MVLKNRIRPSIPLRGRRFKTPEGYVQIDLEKALEAQKELPPEVDID